ncbi:MAG: thrombospondin type 3 repeat-containing protein [Planctomycetes bacterium]|nr:thrombospondin type 3 repeat-containing protein [Planctomycetota bacterium]
MSHPQPSSIVTAILAALAAVLLPGLTPDSVGLRASGGSFAVGLDSDGDGLHDALEARIGTNFSVSDTDSDGLDDYEELLLGADPLTPDNLASFPAEPSLYLDIYQSGPDMVFQIAALSQSAVDNLLFAWATPNGTGSSGISGLRHAILQTSERPSGQAGWSVKTMNLSFPAAIFASVPSMGIGMAAQVDGQLLDASVQLLQLSNVLCQLRDDLIANQGGGGGVFPVEPGGQLASGDPDEVCVQTLVPTAYLPGGKIEYQVAEAKCDPLAGAVCLPGCDGSVLDIVIGIDILSILN